MQVAREREPVSLQDQDRGAEPGDNPVGAVLREAEARWRDAAPGVADGLAFFRAEARWLAAVAALQGAPEDIGHAAECALWDAEREAARNFMWTPAPQPADLPCKMRVIEREADEIANACRDSGSLTEWLAIFQADMLRLLRRLPG